MPASRSDLPLRRAAHAFDSARSRVIDRTGQPGATSGYFFRASLSAISFKSRRLPRCSRCLSLLVLTDWRGQKSAGPRVALLRLPLSNPALARRENINFNQRRGRPSSHLRRHRREKRGERPAALPRQRPGLGGGNHRRAQRHHGCQRSHRPGTRRRGASAAAGNGVTATPRMPRWRSRPRTGSLPSTPTRKFRRRCSARKPAGFFPA